VDHSRHAKPLKTKTPNKPNKSTIEKQMTMGFLLLPAQTTQKIVDHNTSPFQVNRSSNLILQHPPNNENNRRQNFTFPQLTVH